MRILTTISLMIFAAGAALGQDSPISPGFDVISIKPSDPSAHGMSIGLSPSGDFYAKGVTVQALIQEAFNLRPFQLTGGSGWIETERYDIVTKSAVGGFSEAQLGTMSDREREAYRDKLLAKVGRMLMDRFQLKIHRESKDLPVYGLGIAKSGSKLQTTKDDGKSEHSLNMHRDETGKSIATGTKLPLSSLVRLLSSQVGRMVLDQTGLTGNYDFKLNWAPDLGQADPSSPGGDGPSIFTAVQEQLGLKLDSQKGPVEVIVIDSVQKPSEN